MGALALVIGGIGTTNILLANVAERTAEIGLRRAVGATSHDIARQFGFEAVALSAVGGVAGLVIGVVTALAIGWIAGWTMAWSVWTVAVPFAAALAVGALAGVWPARRAADLAPMAAIRGQ
jgi:ABC-type antimicrobial peptide transport system permease subunit